MTLEWGKREPQVNGGAYVLCVHATHETSRLEWAESWDGRWRAVCPWCGQVYVHELMGVKSR